MCNLTLVNCNMNVALTGRDFDKATLITGQVTQVITLL